MCCHACLYKSCRAINHIVGRHKGLFVVGVCGYRPTCMLGEGGLLRDWLQKLSSRSIFCNRRLILLTSWLAHKLLSLSCLLSLAMCIWKHFTAKSDGRGDDRGGRTISNIQLCSRAIINGCVDLINRTIASRFNDWRSSLYLSMVKLSITGSNIRMFNTRMYTHGGATSLRGERCCSTCGFRGESYNSHILDACPVL